MEFREATHGRLGDVEIGADGVRGFLPSGDYGATVGHPLQKHFDVGWRNHLKDFVGGVVHKSADSS